MSKLYQLQQIKYLGLPTPSFTGVSYEEYRSNNFTGRLKGLQFPVAVRSSYSEEDGEAQSYAGHFRTVLNVNRDQLDKAIESVFESYPRPEGQQVIVQEMLHPDFSGVLFAFRRGVWKVEFVEGGGESMVGGQRTPRSLVLPRFGKLDDYMAGWCDFWSGVAESSLKRAFIRLSRSAGVLLDKLPVRHGLDIEFAVVGRQLFLLQARPVTTPEEAESILTTANHREILPEHPSRLMTALMEQSGYQLFDYYRRLDSTLPEVPFIRVAAGMPWLNLSALLDMMVHWGLPTRLIGQSVGAEDCYRVGFRPWRAVLKLGVFWKVLRQQIGARRRVRSWVRRMQKKVTLDSERRAKYWAADSGRAFDHWCRDFRQLYVDLVTHMQQLTGAMAGPVQLLDRQGWLSEVAVQAARKSASTDLLRAFRRLQRGTMDRMTFLEQFGHRGFYESDLGQPRFCEYGESEWRRLLLPEQSAERASERRVSEPSDNRIMEILFRPVTRLIHTREWLRHETMRFFLIYRRELREQCRHRFGAAFDCWSFHPEVLGPLFRGTLSRDSIERKEKADPSGWDMDTFLCNGRERRLPLHHLSNVAGRSSQQNGIGIFPGRISGRVWRVEQAALETLQPPAFDRIILVADALDPGWIPFFTKVDGVVAYTGGLLSHASIILREAGIPAITQLPKHIELRTGDLIEMDGRTGSVTRRKDTDYDQKVTRPI